MLKRAFDIFFSLAVLIPLAPFLVLIALLIKITSRGPVFYRGERIGLHGEPFRMFKFRSMVVNAEKLGGSSVSEDDARITWIGRFLRKSKLDELPQFLNVLFGEMSVVGPRRKWLGSFNRTARKRSNFSPSNRESRTMRRSNSATWVRSYAAALIPTRRTWKLLLRRKFAWVWNTSTTIPSGSI